MGAEQMKCAFDHIEDICLPPEDVLIADDYELDDCDKNSRDYQLRLYYLTCKINEADKKTNLGHPELYR